MLNVAILCAQLAGGFGCIPIIDGVACAQVQTLLHQSVIIESDCTSVEMLAGTEFAPVVSPMPKRRPK